MYLVFFQTPSISNSGLTKSCILHDQFAVEVNLMSKYFVNVDPFKKAVDSTFAKISIIIFEVKSCMTSSNTVMLFFQKWSKFIVHILTKAQTIS